MRDVFNEGVDFPDIETLLFLRPTESKTIFIQQLGRGLRLSPRKEAVTVLDFIGNYKKAGKVRDYLEGLNTNDKQALDKDGKPEYHYPYGCEVNFDEDVIELFKEQEKITNEDLLNNYIRVKEALGRQPTIPDINQNGNYSAYYYLHAFGTWNKFLESVGEVGNLNKEILTKAYFEVKEKLGQVPTKKDIDQNCSFNSGAYQRFWGTWKKFLDSIGEIKLEENYEQKLALNYRKPERRKNKRATDEELIEDYQRVKDILGKQPMTVDYKEHGQYALNTFINRWGSWSDFLKVVGDIPSDLREVTDKELIVNYKQVRDELGKIPTIKQLQELGMIGIYHYQKRFGSYKKFLKDIREKTAQEQLIEEYIKVKDTLGRQPTAQEFSEHGNATWNTVSNYFGSWNKFLIAVGEKTLTGKNIKGKQAKHLKTRLN